MVGTSHLGSWKGHWVMVKSSLGNLRILPPCCYLWVGVAPWLKVARNGQILFWLGTLESARTASGQYCSIMQQTIQKAPCLHGFRSRNTGLDFALPSRRDCFSVQWSHQVPSFWSYWPIAMRMKTLNPPWLLKHHQIRPKTLPHLYTLPPKALEQ